MDLGLAGKRAFVTGGSRGIGLAIAGGLLAEGASVAICGRDADRLREAVTSLGPQAYGVVADVTDHEALRRAVDESAGHFGGLDLLVANAGGAQGGDLLDSTPEDWAATYALNVLHAAHAVRCSVPHFTDGGSVVIVSSITGWKPGPKSSYASAKAAEIHLATTLAAELAAHRVRVNALSPGSTLFEGGGWAHLRDTRPELIATFAHEDFPAGRLVDVQEVADAAVFLLSPRANGVNGTNLCVDGAQDHPSSRRLFPA